MMQHMVRSAVPRLRQRVPTTVAAVPAVTRARAALFPDIHVHDLSGRRTFVAESSSSGSLPPHEPAASSSNTSPSQPPHKQRSSGSSTILIGTLLLGAGAGAYYFFAPSESKRAITSTILPMASTHFTPTTVLSSDPTPLDRSTKVITLKIPENLLPPGTKADIADSSLNGDSLDPIYSVYVKDDDIQVERPYTPLFGIEKDGTVKLWVRRYENGEVGRWMHSKRVGDTVEIRGPVPTWDYEKELKDGQWDEIIMISGGTGITPFFQLIQSQLIHRSPKSAPPLGTTSIPDTVPHLTLLHSSRMPSELPPPMLIDKLATLSKTNADSFTLRLFVDVNDSTASFFSRMDVNLGRIGRTAIEEALATRKLLANASAKPSSPSAKTESAALRKGWFTSASSTTSLEQAASSPGKEKKVLFLVCGPEPMVDSIAGPRPRTRAELDKTGILGELGYKGDNVRRL